MVAIMTTRYKPMELRQYLKEYLRPYGWTLKKGSIDWKLLDENGNFRTMVKIIHPPGNTVHPRSVKSTIQELQKAGKIPP